MLVVGIGFTMGECITALQSMALNINMGENWRWLMALSSLPAFLSLFVSAIWLDESPRFLYVTGQKREASKLLKKMEEQNNQPWFQCCSCCGTEEGARRRRTGGGGGGGGDGDDGGGGDGGEFGGGLEANDDPLVKESLVKRGKGERERESFEDDDEEDDEEGRLDVDERTCSKHASDLYNAVRPLDTAMVWLIFAVCSFLFYGLIWVFPLTLKDGGGQEQSKDVATKVFWGAIAEIPAFLFPILLIDYIGRRGFLIISFFLAIPFAISCAMLAPNLRDKGESTGFFWSVLAMKCLVRGRFFCVVVLFCCFVVLSFVLGRCCCVMYK